MMADEWGVFYCKNCGHESHCGNSLRKRVDDVHREIEVCKSCRCEQCQAPDWG